MRYFLIFSSLVFLLTNCLDAQPDIQLQSFATGFNRPVDIAHCGDERLFIVEQRGIIWILDANGNKLTDPFLNIDPKVGSTGNEQGLLGLAFHPNYAQNGYFFVNYTDNNGDTHIARYSVSAADPNIANPDSELEIMEVAQPYSNHNGGGIKFGPDGYLYIGLGDGGSGGDPQNNGQKKTSFLGKMLRIDVDNGSPYSVPASNPFVNDPAFLPEIWAWGMRNPWRFSFDRLTGDLWIGDVGQDDWEEIDYQPASSTGGENYGWRCYEGTHTYNTGNCPDVSTLTMPAVEFQNSGSLGCSITGGFVYRGCAYPKLYGRYLYTDYCSGRLWSLTPDGNGGWTNEQIADLANNQYVSFGENKDGELFIAALGSGTISRITETSFSFGEVTDEGCGGDSDGAITLDIANSMPPLTFTWSDGFTGQNRTGLTAGFYGVTITTASVCAFFEGFNVNVENQTPDVPVVAVDMDTVLTAPAGFDYQWLLDGQPVPGATGQTFIASQSGSYTVVVTNDGDCSATSEPVNVVISASGFLPNVQSVKFSPNPFSEDATLQIAASQATRIGLKINDLAGKNWLSDEFVVNGKSSIRLPLSKLPAGVYLLVLTTEGGEWVERLVKK